MPLASLNVSNQVIELHRRGKLRLLAVTSEKRVAGAPDIPTARESGLRGLVAVNFAGLFFPAATAEGVLVKAGAALRAALADKNVGDVFARAGLEISTDDTPEKAQRFVAAEIARWTPVIKAIGLRQETSP